MPQGAGIQGAGIGPAGINTPDPVPAPGTALFPDPITGIGQSGRYIHPITKQYTFNADGRTQGYATVQQLVVLALRTVRGSSAIPTLGQSFTSVTEKGPNYQRQVATAVQQALGDLIKAKMIRLVSVSVDIPPSNQDGTIATVLWRDLTQSDPISSGVGGTPQVEFRTTF